MSNGYSPADKKKAGLQPIVGIVADAPISEGVGLSAGGSRHLRVDVKVSGVTVVGSIDLKLQHATNNSESFTDLAGANATVSVTADGVYSMTQVIERAVDQPNMPLKKTLRVVAVTTNAGDEVTVDNVWICQPL